MAEVMEGVSCELKCGPGLRLCQDPLEVSPVEVLSSKRAADLIGKNERPKSRSPGLSFLVGATSPGGLDGSGSVAEEIRADSRCGKVRGAGWHRWLDASATVD